ncbi:MAG: c-type cytochrome [Bacteroidetes bacterium]|nr:c-type cytochrome [Bacteroidota bacterium]
MKKSILILPALLFVFIGYSFHTSQQGRWIAPASADQLSNPYKGNTWAAGAGKKIFNVQCAACHGEQGKGDGIVAVSLTPPPANLQSAFTKTESDGAIYWKITAGNAPMPSYKLALKDPERWQLVTYIRELQNK